MCVQPSVLWRCWLGGRKGIRPVKTERWGAGMVICLEQGADLHMSQLIPLPLTVSCFSKIQIGITFLVSAHPGSPGQRAVKRVCVCVTDVCLSAWSWYWGSAWSICPAPPSVQRAPHRVCWRRATVNSYTTSRTRWRWNLSSFVIVFIYRIFGPAGVTTMGGEVWHGGQPITYAHTPV